MPIESLPVWEATIFGPENICLKVGTPDPFEENLGRVIDRFDASIRWAQAIDNTAAKVAQGDIMGAVGNFIIELSVGFIQITNVALRSAIAPHRRVERDRIRRMIPLEYNRPLLVLFGLVQHRAANLLFELGRSKL